MTRDDWADPGLLGGVRARIATARHGPRSFGINPEFLRLTAFTDATIYHPAAPIAFRRVL